VRYKLAILNALANQPGGRATLDEVRRGAERIVASLDPIQLQRFNALGDLDIFQSGLVLQDDTEWEITPAGLALLDRLEDVPGSTLSLRQAAPSMRSGMTADFLHSEHSSERFDAEVRMPVDVARPIAEDKHRLGATEVRDRKPQNRSAERTSTKGFGVIQRAQKWSRSFSAFVSAKRQSFVNRRRPHSPRTTSTGVVPGNVRSPQTVANAAMSLLALLSVVACVLAAIAFGQIQSLKTDVAALRRELLPLRERFAKFEQIEKQRQDLDQEAQNRSAPEKKKADGELRNEPASLNLTREEVQLIRDYIKPALTPGIAAPEINVGDTVSGATIPLPSPLTEKIAKLQGARFTTRNGSIIIIRSNSRQADAVLNPN
jgi:hypothetical protein